MSHPSQLELDRIATGWGTEAARAHVEACVRCRGRLLAQAQEDGGFVTPELRPRGLRPARRVPWGAAMGGLAAAAAALFVVVQHSAGPPVDRAKGKSIIELMVDRDRHPFAYQDQPLRAGDLLVFRATTRYTQALVVGIEASGRAQVLLSGPDGGSLPLEPGAAKVLPVGVKLDDYRGPERIIMLLSDRRLEGAEAQRRLSAIYQRLPAKQRSALEIGEEELDLGLAEEAKSWTIRREVP